MRLDAPSAAIRQRARMVVELVDGGYGRIEQRRLQTSDVLAGYSDWPGLAQGFQLEARSA